MFIGDRGLGGGRAVANEGVDYEAIGYHYGIYHKSTHLRTMHGGGADTKIEKVHAVVGPRP